ncbi:MAG: phosphatase PAP2 family protein [Planctomycetota bacterium]
MTTKEVASRINGSNPLLRSPFEFLTDLWFERIVLIAMALIAFVPYLLINAYIATWPAINPVTWIDRAIPFVPAMELIYFFVYAIALVPATYVRDAGYFRRIALTFAITQFIAYPIFLLVPVGIDRPWELVDPNGGFFQWVVAFNYAWDAPRNLFPSLHVANAFLTTFVLLRVDRPLGAVFGGVACLIASSTLLLKQHLVVDLVGGLVLAGTVAWFLLRPYDLGGRTREQLCYPRRAILVMPVLYLGVIAAFLILWAMGWQPFSWPPPAG